MRYPLFVLALCFLVAAPHAYACMGLSMEHTLFFDAIPDPQPDAEIIAKVSLSDVKHGAAIATITRIVETAHTEIRVGDKLAVKYQFTSCGPNHRNGEAGLIIAKVGKNDAGHLVLYPYARRYSDNHMTLPLLK